MIFLSKTSKLRIAVNHIFYKGQDKSKKENQEKQSSSSATTQDKPSYHLDDDALQEEYIMEYVKELSLVETRGEVDDAHRLNEG